MPHKNQNKLLLTLLAIIIFINTACDFCVSCNSPGSENRDDDGSVIINNDRDPDR